MPRGTPHRGRRRRRPACPGQRPGDALPGGLRRLPRRQPTTSRSSASKAYLESYPDTELADNAAYWLARELLRAGTFQSGDCRVSPTAFERRTEREGGERNAQARILADLPARPAGPRSRRAPRGGSRTHPSSEEAQIATPAARDSSKRSAELPHPTTSDRRQEGTTTWPGILQPRSGTVRTKRSRERNRGYRSRMRSGIKKLRGLVESGESRRRPAPSYPGLCGSDRGPCVKAAIHRNTADRYKSRLTKLVCSAGQ